MSRSMSMPVCALEFFLPLLVGHPLLEALAELRGHHLAHVGVGDDAASAGT